MPRTERRHNSIVKSATDGGGLFYSIRSEPLPTKTCFDVTFKTFSAPQTEYIATVKIPNNFPFSPPAILLKGDKNVHFKFLSKDAWRPSMSIREMLIEATHELSRRELKPRRPQVQLTGKNPTKTQSLLTEMH